MTTDEKFVSRWSRLKTEARQPETKPPEPKADFGPAGAAAPPSTSKDAGASAPKAPQLPPIDSLKGLASEYTEFLKPGVDEGLRRAALKKLFRDPYFETFEKFAEYCEDYTQGEPIPPAMLKTLEHAKGLLFDEKEEEKKGASEVAASARALPESPGQSERKTETKPEAAQQPEQKA